MPRGKDADEPDLGWLIGPNSFYYRCLALLESRKRPGIPALQERPEVALGRGIHAPIALLSR
jgi:hypothetical protein